jgi:hypothetical protein
MLRINFFCILEPDRGKILAHQRQLRTKCYSAHGRFDQVLFARASFRQQIQTSRAGLDSETDLLFLIFLKTLDHR